MYHYEEKRSRLTNIHRGVLLILLVIVVLLTGTTPPVDAAEEWDTALEEISDMHGDYTALQGSIKLEKQKIQQLRKQNNEDLKALNTNIQGINQILLKRLKSEAELTRKKYAPLLEQYSSLTKQATAAKKAKNSKNAALLDLKRNKLKPAVALARNEVKAITGALATARKNTASTTKMLRDLLSPVSVLKKQITAENKNLAVIQKNRSLADIRYKAAIKQGDAMKAITEMKLSYSLMSKIHNGQLKIYGWEQSITRSIRAAQAKLP